MTWQTPQPSHLRLSPHTKLICSGDEETFFSNSTEANSKLNMPIKWEEGSYSSWTVPANSAKARGPLLRLLRQPLKSQGVGSDMRRRFLLTLSNLFSRLSIWSSRIALRLCGHNGLSKNPNTALLMAVESGLSAWTESQTGSGVTNCASSYWMKQGTSPDSGTFTVQFSFRLQPTSKTPKS